MQSVKAWKPEKNAEVPFCPALPDVRKNITSSERIQTSASCPFEKVSTKYSNSVK